jgi:hypothetical protein
MKQDKRTPGKLEGGVKQAYTVFLSVYPAPFRRTFTAEMAEVFADQVDEAARRGTRPLLRLAAREIWYTSAAISRAYWLNRSKNFAFFGDLVSQFIKALFSPEPLGSPDGRTSWTQTAREVALFGILGAGQIINTYLPAPAWKPLFDLLAALVLSLPLLWLLIGLARGMPRWAYPSLGILLGYGFIASLAAGAAALFGFLLVIALTLLVLAYRVDRKRPFLPDLFRTWRQSLSTDITRLSFGAYGFLALAIMVAFDDAYANNRTAWLLVSVLCMLGGAVCYCRSRKPAAQLSFLTAGMTCSLLAAMLDHARFAALQWPGPIWIVSLWCNLLILIFLPPAVIRILRFFHTRAWRARPTPGG